MKFQVPSNSHGCGGYNGNAVTQNCVMGHAPSQIPSRACSFPYDHATGCTCGARPVQENINVDTGSGSRREPGPAHSQTHGPPLSTATAEASWWGPRPTMQTYFSAFGHLNSTDSVPQSSAASPGNSASQPFYPNVSSVYGHPSNDLVPFTRQQPGHQLHSAFAVPPSYSVPDHSTPTNSSDFHSLPGSASSGYLSAGPPSAHLLSTPADSSFPQRPMPETPQSSLSGASTSPPSGTSLGSNTPTLARSYGSSQRGSNGEKQITFPRLEVLHDLSCDGHPVTPDIQARIDTKNVFWQDSQWTCYRRNYIAVACHYTLTYCDSRSHLLVKEGGRQLQVQALGLCLSATSDHPHGKSIGLVKHTPKRDRGPQCDVKIEKLAPAHAGGTGHSSYQPSVSPGPLLPLQQDERQPTTCTPPGQYTFERIQFKQATANNGRRRATQQFYHLVVELHADVRASAKDKNPRWIKVAQRISEAMVVRGRSPGHYKDTPRDNGGHSRPSGGGSGGGGGLGSFSGFPGAGGPSSKLSGFGFGLSTPGVPPMYGSHSRPFDSQCSSSSTSLSSVSSPGASPFDHRAQPHNDTLMTEDEAYDFHHADGYRYYPHALYDTVMQPAPSHCPTRPGLKLEEYCSNTATPTTTSSSSLIGSCDGGGDDAKYDKRPQGSVWCPRPAFGRFHGVDSSRGHFPPPAPSY